MKLLFFCSKLSDLVTIYFDFLDLLDEEIDTIRALIGTYDAKIALLEEKLANKGTTVNKKGKRVRAEQMTFTDGAEMALDYY